MDRTQRDYYQYRILEIIPGFLVWLTFAVAISLSITNPLLGIYVIIAFDVYWILRISYMTIFLMMSWFKYRQVIKVNWLEKLMGEFPQWTDYYHIIFLPTAGEPYEVIDNTLTKLAETNYDHKKMIIVLAGEGRFSKQFEPIAAQIKQKYQDEFHKIFITIHPYGLPGEVVGKGSNMYHAGHEIKKYIDAQNYDYKKLIVSAFDIDTVTHRQYFSLLTYRFISHPNPYRASFQPLAFFHNNTWESDLITRTVANSTTFWLMTDLSRPDRLFTFSSHSMSWQALVDIGFWQNNIVTEDSRIFLQCFIHYDGNYQTVPLHIPVSMNTVYAGHFWRSMRSQYKQMQRWAYGSEHFPYMVWLFKRAKKMPLNKKIAYIWNQTEGVYSWATAPLIILVLGRLPLYIAEKQGLTNVLTQNAPLLLEGLMRFGLFGLVIIAIMNVIIMPPMPSGTTLHKLYRYPLMFLQWAIFPITMIIFGSIPAVDAQTRLMFGKYLGFNVTPKKSTN